MPTRLLDKDQVLDVLRGTPDRLRSIGAAASESELAASPAPGEWSLRDVLAHLRACADVWGSAVETIVREPHPTIQAVNPRSWIDKTDYRERAFGASLRSFDRQRARLLSVLEPLPRGGWSRTAVVRGAGTPAERSVHDYADRLARHERGRLRQMERTLATFLD